MKPGEFDCLWCDGDGGRVDPKTFEFDPCVGCKATGKELVVTDEDWKKVKAALNA